MSAQHTPPDATPSRPAPGWSAPVRIVVSLLLAWHLVALLVGPISLPPSLLGRTLRPYFQAYMATTYLDHAYKFFAPDPGPSHLLRYELTMADGTQRKGTFPDAQRHWPRLLYHRHFMLSEFVNDGRPPEFWEAEATADTPQPPPWQPLYFESYARHLLAAHEGAEEVTLIYRQHVIPRPEDVLTGVRLDDARYYSERKLGTWRSDAP